MPVTEAPKVIKWDGQELSYEDWLKQPLFPAYGLSSPYGRECEALAYILRREVVPQDVVDSFDESDKNKECLDNWNGMLNDLVAQHSKGPDQFMAAASALTFRENVGTFHGVGEGQPEKEILQNNLVTLTAVRLSQFAAAA